MILEFTAVQVNEIAKTGNTKYTPIQTFVFQGTTLTSKSKILSKSALLTKSIFTNNPELLTHLQTKSHAFLKRIPRTSRRFNKKKNFIEKVSSVVLQLQTLCERRK